MKKKMYYNMRIKTLKRNCSNVLLRSRETVKLHIQKIEEVANRVRLEIAGLRAQVDNCGDSEKENQKADANGPHAEKLRELGTVLDTHEGYKSEFRQKYAVLRRQTIKVSVAWCVWPPLLLLLLLSWPL